MARLEVKKRFDKKMDGRHQKAFKSSSNIMVKIMKLHKTEPTLEFTEVKCNLFQQLTDLHAEKSKQQQK